MSAMTLSEEQRRKRARSNVRLAILLGAVALLLYLSFILRMA